MSLLRLCRNKTDTLNRNKTCPSRLPERRTFRRLSGSQSAHFGRLQTREPGRGGSERGQVWPTAVTRFSKALP